MEEEFKREKYSPNRSTLKDICQQLHINTNILTPPWVTRPASQRATSSSTPRRATSPTPQTSFTKSESERDSKEREKRLDKRMKAFGYAIIFVVCGTIPSIMVGLISDHSNDNSGTITLSLIFLCAIIGAFVGWNKGN